MASDRDPFFDPWMILRHPALEILVTRWLQEEEAAAVKRGVRTPRARKRKNDDVAAEEAIANSVVANLARACLTHWEPQPIAIVLAKPRAPRSRYDRLGLRQLPNLIRRFERIGLLTLEVSHRRGRASIIRPARWLPSMLKGLAVRSEHLDRLSDEETIILSRAEWDYAARIKHRHRIEYQDTPQTHRYRREMRTINDRLGKASIEFFDGRLHEPVGTSRRHLHRVFNIPAWLPEETKRFDLGGRLAGGFWQELNRHRRHGLTIDSETVADLDFQNLFVRLAYLQAGHTPPDGDLYAGIIEARREDKERIRDGIKRFTMSLLFASKPLSRMPRGEDRKPLVAGYSGKEVRSLVLEKHPALASVIETGLGWELMYTESSILVAALLSLAEADITALPMHDGVMVPTSRKEKALIMMMDAAEAVTGHRLPALEKPVLPNTKRAGRAVRSYTPHL